MALTKEQILAAEDTSKVFGPYPVPEWGGDIYLRSLKASDVDRYESSLTDKEGRITKRENYKARFLVMCLCDSGGKPLFDRAEAGALGLRHARVLSRLFDIARRVNGLDADTAEELEGNSEGTVSAVSVSD